MATLCLINEDGEVMDRWELNGKAVTIGRSVAVDLKIADEGLSRRHFMIMRQDEQYVLKDLSSRNGTWVDGVRVVATTLIDNHSILAGRTEFRFYQEEPAELDFRPRTGPNDTVVISAVLAR